MYKEQEFISYSFVFSQVCKPRDYYKDKGAELKARPPPCWPPVCECVSFQKHILLNPNIQCDSDMVGKETETWKQIWPDSYGLMG